MPINLIIGIACIVLSLTSVGLRWRTEFDPGPAAAFGCVIGLANIYLWWREGRNAE